MKKLLMALAVISVGTVASAAAFTWKTGTSNQVYLMNTSDRAANMTAYLFSTAAVSQSDVYDTFAAGTSIGTLTSKATATTSAQGAVTGSFEADAGDVFTGYFAIVTNVGGTDYLYISTEATGTAPATGSATLTFKEKATSQLAASTSSYSGAGWYAVPEPTSGLLMLLGMAGLALKRKRA